MGTKIIIIQNKLMNLSSNTIRWKIMKYQKKLTEGFKWRLKLLKKRLTNTLNRLVSNKTFEA